MSNKTRRYKFSHVLLLSTLLKLLLMVGMLIFFFHSIITRNIRTNFNQEIQLEANTLVYDLNQTFQNLQKDLSTLNASNALRVALRLGMENSLREIVNEHNRLGDGNASLYVLDSASQQIYPEPEPVFLPYFQRPRGALSGQKPTVIRYDERFYLILSQKVILRENRELGEIFLRFNLSGSGLWTKSLRGDSASTIIAVEYNGDYYDLRTGDLVKTNSAEIINNYARQNLPNYFQADILVLHSFAPLRAQTDQLLARFVLFAALIFLLTIAISLFITRVFSAPLENLTTQAAALAVNPASSGLDTAHLHFQEFSDLTASFNTVLLNFQRSRSEICQLNADLEGRVRKRTSELSSANLLLRAREEQLKLIVERVPCATCMFDTGINAITSSRMWKELFGTGDNGNFLDTIPEYRDYWEKVFSDCMRGDVRHCSEKRMLIRGREFWLRWEGHPYLTSNNTIGGVIVFIEDVTAQKWSEEAFKRAAREAENANRLKSEFLANVSHEIRTPLNCIIGFAEIISENADLSEIHAQAELILSESDNLLTLINDLLDFSKIEAGRLDTESTDFDLHELVNDIIPGVRLRLRHKPVEFTIEIKEGVPQFLHGDPFRLRQVIMNLVHNSVKFTEKGHIRLVVSLASRLPGAYKLHFSIEDSGIGIPPEKQKTIFDKFTQADGSTTRKYGGTGLGTTISKKLVEIMGGNIGLRSTPGKGSCFWFTLPFTPGEEPQEGKSEHRVGMEQLAAERLCHILLAEDYLPNQLVAQTHLESSGYKVDIANNGLEALRKAEAVRYALVLMDLNMPEMDGFEALEKIRAHFGGSPPMPIIALTASAEPVMRSKCLNSGFDDIIAKPIRKADLIGTIRRWLKQSEGAREDNALAELEAARPLDAEGKNIALRRAARKLRAVLNPENETRADGEMPVDFPALSKDYPGKEALVQRLLLQFSVLLEGQIEVMDKAVQEHDALALRAETHKLIGGAGTLRVTHIYHAAQTINEAAKDGDYPACAEGLETIRRQLSLLRELLARQTNQ